MLTSVRLRWTFLFLSRMAKEIHTILSIGGSDSSGGAGVQADIRTSLACGLFPMTAITAITAQNSKGVSAVSPVSSELLLNQLESIFNEKKPEAIKIGILGCCQNIITVSKFLKKHAEGIPVVVDPVIRATTGGELNIDTKEVIAAFLNHLFPISTVVTPNIKEARLFTESSFSKEELAFRFLNISNADSIVLKSGDDEDEDIISDFLAIKGDDKDSILSYTSPRIKGANFHGTGCSFATLLASGLAYGLSISQAFRFASFNMKKVIEYSLNLNFSSFDYPPLAIGYNPDFPPINPLFFKI